MSKPTRDEFAATVASKWPGATMVMADRGLYIVVGTRAVAEAIEFDAKAAGYRPTRVEQRGTEDFMVSIFGFPRLKADLPTVTTVRERVLARCRELGVIVHADDDEVNLEAPHGYVWDGDTHELVHSPLDLQTRAAMWRAALADLESCTLAKCTIPDCEWCNDEDKP